MAERKISTAVYEAEIMFALFNDYFYNGEINTPAITLAPDGGRKAYGWVSVQEIWNVDGKLHRELNLSAEYLNRPIAELSATMLHEMAHLYNLQNEIEDVSNNGYYHNKNFKKTAEEHGLIINKHPRYGWTISTLNEEAANWVQEALRDFTIGARRLTTIEVSGNEKGKGDKGTDTDLNVGRRTKSKNRSIKYICPECGTIIRANKVVNVDCGDCKIPFILG